LQPKNVNKNLLTICLAGTTLFAGCAAWPGLDDPLLSIAPEYTLFQMTGQTRMEAGPPNLGRRGKNSVAQLGADDREDNIGVRASYGDGVSGFEFHYGRFESHSSQTGLALNDWGNIPRGEVVDTRVTMDEFRLRYIAAMGLYEGEDEDEWLQAGVGVQLGHKEMTFDVRGVSTGVGQKIEIKDDISPMLAVRVAGHRGPWGVTLDLAYNYDWSLGTGDITGAFYDASVRVSYYLEAQDITVFGGYRRFDIPARGRDGILEYDVDFTLDGYVFGFEFDF
jgi:hypothetical protein